MCVMNTTSGRCAMAPNGRSILGEVCPVWAGGDGVTMLPPNTYGKAAWVELNYTVAASGTGLVADLAPLNGTAPVGVRYAWDSLRCCDLTNPATFVSEHCIAQCPVMSTAGLPANPFSAKIVDGACSCLAPQVCS